jgi:predicted Rossmann fold flavoprotein
MARPQTLLVVGGGAAGFFCAVNAARMNPGLKVILLEKTGKLLSKVKVSGGGRCNVTHACFDIKVMSERYPRGKNFVKKTFHRFFTKDTIRWFEERDVILKEEEDGRMFPVTDSSQTIIDCLLREAGLYNVDVYTNTEVVKLQKSDMGFIVETSGNKITEADFVCIASGGYPKTSMWKWLEAVGHTIEEPVPSLFTFNLPHHPLCSLMGISLESARVKIEGTKLSEQGAILITHWGLSGPAVLKLSAWGAVELKKTNYEFRIHINWLTIETEQSLKQKLSLHRATSPAKKMINLSLVHLPARLWEFLLKESAIAGDKRIADLSSREENLLIRNLLDYTADVRGKTTFKEEFVTAGGIRLSEIDPNTMMSKMLPGLYFAGEVMDVDGITGGFNFQHAWTSGYIAAKSIAAS